MTNKRSPLFKTALLAGAGVVLWNVVKGASAVAKSGRVVLRANTPYVVTLLVNMPQNGSNADTIEFSRGGEALPAINLSFASGAPAWYELSYHVIPGADTTLDLGSPPPGETAGTARILSVRRLDGKAVS